MKRLGFLYPFLVVGIHGLFVDFFICVEPQHNMDYVLAAVFGGYFYIINRILSIR